MSDHSTWECRKCGHRYKHPIPGAVYAVHCWTRMKRLSQSVEDRKALSAVR